MQRQHSSKQGFKAGAFWWIQNLEICNGMSLNNQPPQSLLQTDALLKGNYIRELDMSGDNVACQRARTPGSEIFFLNNGGISRQGQN